MNQPEKLVMVGWGAIAQRVADLLSNRGGATEIVAIGVRSLDLSRANLPSRARILSNPTELRQGEAHLVVEAAGKSSVLPWGRAALAAGSDFAITSTAALADEVVLDELLEVAARYGKRVVVPAGAIGGIDALSAASRLGLTDVEHRITKPSSAWRSTNAEGLCDLPKLKAATQFFSGSARKAAEQFPQNANVTVISALAGIGLDRTTVTLVADPHARSNQHVISARGEFGELEIRVKNRPLVGNEKSSEMTALNLVRLIENRTATLAI